MLGPEYYDEAFAKGYDTTRFLPLYKAILAELDKADRLVYDLGCGTGALTEMLHQAGKRVIAIDFSKEAVRQTMDRFPGVVVRMDLEAPIPLGFGDAMILCEVLEHLERDVHVLAGALIGGKRVLASVPSGGMIPSETHVREYTKETIRNRFSHLGNIRFIHCSDHSRIVFEVI